MALKLCLITFCITVVVQKGNSAVFPSSAGITKCAALCDEKYPIASNNVGRKDSCSRGCRFYEISQLMGNIDHPEPDEYRQACQNCCSESFEDNNDKEACNMGCDTMAKHQIEGMNLSSPSKLTMAITLEEKITKHNGEMLEPDDALTDPGLRKQLLLALVDEIKLPEMKVKTLPVVNMEKNVFEVENQDNLCSDCTVRKVAGGPNCIAASFVLLVVIFALWLLLSCEEKSLLASSPTNYDSEQAPPLPTKYVPLESEKVFIGNEKV